MTLSGMRTLDDGTRTIIGLYFELCLDEAGSSTGYGKLSFDEVSMCSSNSDCGLNRHSENIVHHDLDVSFRDINTPQIIRPTLIVNEGLPDLHASVEDTICIEETGRMNLPFE